jgi:HK97 family phage portal protein
MNMLWSTGGLGTMITQPSTLTRVVWNAETARSIPGMARALQLYGLIATCPLIAQKGLEVVPGPRILRRPDPDMPRATHIKALLEDYWLHGNALEYITTFDAAGRPWADRYYPVHRWGIEEVRNGQPVYMLDGQEVPRERVIHHRRGIDPNFIHRGLGVVEEHMRTLNRAGLQESAETSALTDRGMPSVAIIKPNPDPDPVGDDLVADKWVERFSGSTPKPGIFPAGTSVIPLSWNPSDGQMVEARKLTITDLANLMNLDPYWLGAEGSSHNYKSPGLMFLGLLKTSLDPVMEVFEDEWSFRWLAYGTDVRFDRAKLLRDDLETMVRTFAAGKAAGIFPDVNEARTYMGFPPLPEAQIQDQLEAPTPPALELVPPNDDEDDTEESA